MALVEDLGAWVTCRRLADAPPADPGGPDARTARRSAVAGAENTVEGVEVGVATSWHTLGVLSDWQYRSLAVEMSSLGYRTSEPGDLEAEAPTVLSSLITWHLE